MSRNDSSISDGRFRFYDLLPELRSMIFQHATTDIVIVDGVLAGGCCTQLLLVSRHFRDEYVGTVFLHARLTRQSELHRDGRVLRGVDSMHRLQHLTLRIPLYYGDAVPFQRSLEDAQTDLQALLAALPALRTVHVQLDLDTEDVRMMIDRDDVDRTEYVLPEDVAALLDLFTPQLSATNLPNCDRRRITINQEVVLHGRLAEPTTAAARQIDWNTIPWMSRNIQNSPLPCDTFERSGCVLWIGVGDDGSQQRGESRSRYA
ncbi:hypothetical protein LTR35_008871 [Friedmanniomyces endolithicus]|uniref:Uncharacterized protein n=1 Tax=Friedmanniomyces endolithicus TaxID=329885 RepID=A0AAN6FPC7_9PEZI|nr:hypothetical protein LTR35_008871 [Friedmanniomyces endolithicus]KAK0294944.1 hypothetical protein LTS00_006410 [Friedmanniomyces endolithicus]KAK0319798.1 hypothetical protein LTR82_009133 [Friedmanniomyces endolithicus]KAK0985031.1 hypothetical protein LTR54_013831 [Friedmanniomyces endolithicus]